MDVLSPLEWLKGRHTMGFEYRRPLPWLRVLFGFFVCLAGSVSQTYAATLEYIGLSQPVHNEWPCASKYENYRVAGPIVQGDLIRIKALQAQQQAKNAQRQGEHCTVLRLNLDSEGGNFSEALDIAAYLWFSGIHTYVGPSAKCLSACALIFMGGATHVGDGYRASSRTLHYQGRLGFHAPFLNPRAFNSLPAEALRDVPAQSFQGALEAAAKLLRFSSRTGLPTTLIEEMLEVPADRFIEVDSIGRLARWGIRVEGFPANLPFGRLDLARLCANHHLWFHQAFRPLADGELLDNKAEDAAAWSRLTNELERALTVEGEGEEKEYIISPIDNEINCQFGLTDAGTVATRKLDPFSSLHVKPNRLWYALSPSTSLADAARSLAARAADKLPSTKDAAPAEQLSFWIHNSSEMKLTIIGGPHEYGVTMEYAKPRPSMVQEGVLPGNVLFHGTLSGGRLAGFAYVFRKNCPPLSYQVAGPFALGHSVLILEGASPKFKGNACLSSPPDPRSKSSTLRFELRASSGG